MGRSTQRIVGLAVLFVLAALPVMATTCEALCKPVHTTSASADEGSSHDGMSGCHESSPLADERLTPGTTHDCGTHELALRETEPATTAARAATAVPLTTTILSLASSTPASSLPRAHTGHVFPPGSSAPHASLVLRI